MIIDDIVNGSSEFIVRGKYNNPITQAQYAINATSNPTLSQQRVNSDCFFWRLLL